MKYGLLFLLGFVIGISYASWLTKLYFWRLLISSLTGTPMVH